MAGERVLKVTVTGEDKGASRALKNVDDAAEKVGNSTKVAGTALDNLTSKMTQNLGPASSVVKGKLDDIGNSALSSGNKLGTGLAVGAAAAGVAIAAFAAKGVADFVRLTDEVDAIQDTMGGTAEEASKLRNIGAALGVETNALAGAFVKLSQNIDKGKLAEFGVEVARNKDGTTDLYGTLLNVADAYNATTDPIQRNVLVTTAFGKSGKELIDVLERGRGELEKFGKAGPIFSEEDLSKGREFKIAMEQMKASAQTLSVELGSALVPAITSVVNAVTTVTNFFKVAAKDGSFFGQVLAGVKDHFQNILNPLGLFGSSSDSSGRAQAELKIKLQETAAALEEQQRKLDALTAAQLASINSTLGLAGAHHSAQGAALAVEKAQAAYNKAVEEHGPKSEEARQAAFNLEGANLSQTQTLVNLAQKLADQEVAQARANGETVNGQEAAAIFRARLLEVANTVADPLRGQLIGLAQNIRDVPDGKDIPFTTNAGQVAGQVYNLRDAINSVGGGMGANFSLFGGGRAAGGPVSPGVTYMVGERGPELLTMGSMGGYVTPNGGGGTINHTTVIAINDREMARVLTPLVMDEIRRKGAIGAGV